MEIKEYEANLVVRPAHADDVFKDIARIHESDRKGSRAGLVYRLSVNRKTAFTIVRGMKDGAKGTILLDEITRDNLGIEINEQCLFKIAKAGFWGQLRWSWGTSDPAYRVAARLALISLGLGVLGLVLGVLSFV